MKLMVKRSRSHSLAIKNTFQRTAQHYYIELGLLLHGSISSLRLGIKPFLPAVMVFGYGQSPSSTAYESVCPIRFRSCFA